MIKTKLFILITLFYLSVTPSIISFYLERQPKTYGYDFLHLFLHDPSSPNKKKLIFRLPKPLKNQEVFKFKICNKNTIKKLKSKNQIDSTLDQNCLKDALNTVIVIDYDEKMILDEIPIYNLYKICVFGFAFPEGIKSYLFAGLTSILMKNEISDGKGELYYNDATSATELFDEGLSMNYLFLFNSSEAYRCKMEVDEGVGELKEEKFLDDVFFLERKGESSYFIVEYDFGEDFKPVISKSEYFENSEMEPDMRIKRRQQVLDSLKKNMNLERTNFYKAEFEFTVFKNENDSIPCIKLLRNKTMETLQSINIDINTNKYIRFFPMLCNKLLEHDKTHSFEFLSEHACTPLSQKKILIGKGIKGNPYFFTQTQSGDVKITKKLRLFAQEMDFYIYPKSDPEDITIIKGYLPKCDTIFDKNTDLLYYICYQKTTIYENNKLLPTSQKDLQINNFILSDNSSPSPKTRRKVKGVPFGVFIVASLIFTILSILALIFLTGGIACIIGLLSGIVMMIGMFVTKKRNLGHQGRLNPKKSFADVDLVERRNWVTPLFFLEEEGKSGKPVFRVVVDCERFGEKMEVEDLKKVPKKKNGFLMALEVEVLKDKDISFEKESDNDLKSKAGNFDNPVKNKLLINDSGFGKNNNHSILNNSVNQGSILNSNTFKNQSINGSKSIKNKSINQTIKNKPKNQLMNESIKIKSINQTIKNKSKNQSMNESIKNKINNISLTNSKKSNLLQGTFQKKDGNLINKLSNSLSPPQKNDLNISKSDLNITKSDLNISKSDLNILKSDLNLSKSQIKNLISSKKNKKNSKSEILNNSFIENKNKNNFLLEKVGEKFKSNIIKKKNENDSLLKKSENSNLKNLNNIDLSDINHINDESNQKSGFLNSNLMKNINGNESNKIKKINIVI